MEKYTFICQNCNKRFIDKRNAYRNPKFCSRDCHHKYKRKTVKCLYCDKEFITVKSNKRKFCSTTCSNRYHKIKDPNKKKIFTCKWCENKFEEWTYRNRKFCSKQCMSEFAARQPKPKARKPEIHITKICENCQKPYKTTTHQVRLRGSRFCSRKCLYEKMSTERIGENNPNWNEGSVGLDAYGPNWNSQKRKAKHRDKHTCQMCGYKSGGNRFLDVHHIIPIKKFNGDWKKSNKLSNLICLCRPCHIKVEHGKISLPE